MPSQKVEFPGSHGSALAARLDLPAASPLAYALFAHCFTCSKETKAATYISKALVDAGIAVLRFDFTGLGGSEGDFSNTNFSSNAGDLVAAAAWLREHYEAPAILLGHSLGGAAVLAAAEEIPEALAVATVGAPFDPAHVSKLLGPASEVIAQEGHAEVNLAGRTFLIRRQFLDDLTSQAPEERLRKLGRALLIFHSPVDTVVDIHNAQQIYLAAKHPKSFVSLDHADHLLTKASDGLYVGQVLAAWAKRYLPAPAPADAAETAPATAIPESLAEGVVLVEERRDGKFTNTVRTAKHEILADEPLAVGGNERGLSPYELLSAALGACTAMTLRMYADLKKIPLEQVKVELKHGKIHAADCADCATTSGKIDRIERAITLEGELDDAQRARLLEIADKCPVHRTLHSEVQVVTRLVQGL